MRVSLAKTVIFGVLMHGAAAVGQETVEEAAPAEDQSAAESGAPETEPGGATEPGAEAEEVGSAVDAFFNGTTKENVKARAEEFYAQNATLTDPFGTFEGRDAIVKHLETLFENVESISFEIKAEFVSGEETVSLWTMTLSHTKLEGGEPITVDGVTHVRFEGGKAVAQRDFYDLGEMLYEHTTIVGRIVKWVKAKAAGL